MKRMIGKVFGRITLAAAACLMFSGAANAQSEVMKGKWQWSFLPSIQKYTEDMDIDGGRFGFFTSNGTVDGFDLACINWTRDNFSGCGFGLFLNMSQADMVGYQLAPVGIVRKDMTGCEMGFYTKVEGNVYGAQVGVLNFCESIVRGGQLGFVNHAENLKGVQLGLFNFVETSLKGVQIGIFNMLLSRERGQGVPVLNISF